MMTFPYSVKIVEVKKIEVKANEKIPIEFSIENLPSETSKVEIKAIKKNTDIHTDIEFVEQEVLVHKHNRIYVNFKFLATLELQTDLLEKIFVCKVIRKMPEPNDSNHEIVANQHQNSNLQQEKEKNDLKKYLKMLRDKQVTWDEFLKLIVDLPRTHIDVLLLQEIKTLHKKLEESNQKLQKPLILQEKAAPNRGKNRDESNKENENCNKVYT